MIVLVVNMHACVTYTHIGSWYFMSDREPSLAEKLPFLFWQAHLQAFFMGLLFFLAGSFAEASLAKKGRAGFLRERALRLGVPTLLFAAILHPLTLGLLKAAGQGGGFTYAGYLRSGAILAGTGPLWFAEALLVFCVVLALSPRRRAVVNGEARIRAGRIAAFALAVGLASFAVRIVQPIGASWLNLQLCFFPQYVAAFAAGVWVHRRRALETLARNELARKAGWIAFVLGPTVLVGAFLTFGPPPVKGANPYFGGLGLPSLLTCLWEQFAGVGLALGALAFALRRLDEPAPRGRWLSGRAFGVYFLHTPILVALALLFRPLVLPLGVSVVLLTLTGLVASFAAADLARRVPVLGAFLG